MSNQENSQDKSNSRQQRNPLLDCSEQKFLLDLKEKSFSNEESEKYKEKLKTFILKNGMIKFYEKFILKSNLIPIRFNQKQIDEISKENEKKLKEAEQNIENAKTNMGESEVCDQQLAKSRLLAKISDKETTLKSYEETLNLSVGTNSKLEVIFDILQYALFLFDFSLLHTEIERAKKLLEEGGGDQEGRNKLKVYEATYLMSIRDFESSCKLLLDSIATFSCYELFSYNRFIFYTVVVSMISLDRVQLREKVVECPEILSVIDEIPFLKKFLMSLFRCEYRNFFPSLLGIIDMVSKDQQLATHTSHYLREIRGVVYTQFLEPYQSVTIASMADSFGVSEEFIDRELSRYISSGRLNAKIDKVGGIIETNRPDAKNAQYLAIIKQGDLLLNNVQKLSRVITF